MIRTFTKFGYHYLLSQHKRVIFGVVFNTIVTYCRNKSVSNMKDNSILSTNCLIVDTMSFDRLFMCKLERTRHKTNLFSLLKKTEKNKLEDAYLLFIFWPKLFICYTGFKILVFFKFQHSKNLSLWRFQAKEIFFTATLII